MAHSARLFALARVLLLFCSILVACETRTGGDEVVLEAGTAGAAGSAGAMGDAATDSEAAADAVACTEPGQPCDGVTVSCCEGLCGREGICPVYED
jgi:hypothetical protein